MGHDLGCVRRRGGHEVVVFTEARGGAVVHHEPILAEHEPIAQAADGERLPAVDVDAVQDLGSTLSYLYLFRFIYPETGFFGTYGITENMELKLSVRGYWPLYLLWSPDDPPFPEGLLVTGLISVIWHLPPNDTQTKS